MTREDLGSASSEPAGKLRRRCLIILPRNRSSEYDVVKRYFAGADCEVIIDRREAQGHIAVEGRAASLELQRGERRSGRLEASATAVIFVS